MKTNTNENKNETKINVYLRDGELVGQIDITSKTHQDYVTSAKSAEGFVMAVDWLGVSGCEKLNLAESAVVYFTAA